MRIKVERKLRDIRIWGRIVGAYNAKQSVDIIVDDFVLNIIL